MWRGPNIENMTTVRYILVPLFRPAENQPTHPDAKSYGDAVVLFRFGLTRRQRGAAELRENQYHEGQ
jgi:hypothetical protein